MKLFMQSIYTSPSIPNSQIPSNINIKHTHYKACLPYINTDLSSILTAIYILLKCPSNHSLLQILSNSELEKENNLVRCEVYTKTV